ncbi:MAG TPA: GDSL-type esterase/lipase family protein [Vicinamibacterales bacterium]|nr:GDSL-type esterase/lipase family protein [Vicinamibacterales bacterium]
MPVRRACLAVALGVALFAPAPRAQPQTGGIVFVGSSIFHRWTQLSAQMAPLPIINLAIDGTVTADMLRMLDSRVIPLRPKVIAYYCGSNDVDTGEPAAAIVGRIVQFVDRVGQALPDTRVIFVSVNRAPEKQDRWDVVDAVNRQVQAYAASHPRVEYVEVNPVLFNADGSSRLDLFMGDQLHLRPRAYEEFAKILKPVLTRALNP